MIQEELPDYSPLWPETIVFWGAGATRALGMRTTVELGVAIYQLAADEGTVRERVQEQFPLSSVAEPIEDLLMVLGEEAEGDQALVRLFPALSPVARVKRQTEMKSSYDWITLRQLVRVCPGHTAEGFRLQDLFTLLDMHIESRHGFYVPRPGRDGRHFIAPECLLPARNALVMLIGLLHYHDFHRNLLENKEVYDQYISFAHILAQMMAEEGDCLAGQGCYASRHYYLLSYAVISMNWDPILLWLLFNAYNDMNDQQELDGTSLRLFHDFGHYIGLRQVDGSTPRVWYPVNEAVVQRLNNPECGGRNRIRAGKYYFPHGCSGWRECPNCGKLTLFLGDSWQVSSASLYPPPLPGQLSEKWQQPRSQQEQQEFAAGRFDALQCAYCGAMTEMKHAPLVMQTGLKGRNPAFVEDIHHEMRIALENADHIVLMGYTLPPDDGIYRSVLAARQKRGWGGRPFCSVVVGVNTNAPDKWLRGEELRRYIMEHGQSPFAHTIRAAQEIFSPHQVRGYGRGIPAVFAGQSGEASYEKVRQLLYPKECFGENYGGRSL